MALAFGSVEIVAVQLRSVKDPDHNLNRMRQILDENVSGAVDLVVFPETSMTSFGTSGDAMVSQSQGLDGPFVAGLVHLAERFDTHVSAGMFETNEAGLPFNTTVVVTFVHHKCQRLCFVFLSDSRSSVITATGSLQGPPCPVAWHFSLRDWAVFPVLPQRWHS